MFGFLFSLFSMALISRTGSFIINSTLGPSTGSAARQNVGARIGESRGGEWAATLRVYHSFGRCGVVAMYARNYYRTIFGLCAACGVRRAT